MIATKGKTPMKKIVEGIGSSALKGLFTLLPILLLYLLLAEIFQLLVALATPIADALFPPDVLEHIQEEVLVAIVLLFGVSLIIGLLSKSNAGKKAGLWLEKNTIDRIPLYQAVKRLILGFTNADQAVAFVPGLLNSQEGEQDLIYVIEDHGNGKLTVMLPWAPAAFAGNIKVVDASKVEIVDSNIGEYSKILSHWGLGLPKVLNKKTES
jgi:uncharacterized membrane protein